MAVGFAAKPLQCRHAKRSAYLEIFQRLDNGLPTEDDGAKCSLQQAYSSLIAKGAVLVWRPFDVDQLIAAIWPNHAVPSQDGRISLSLTDRCLRLADPWCGIGRISGLMPCGRPRNLSSWATDLVLEMSHAAGTEVSIAEQRFVVRQTLKDKQTSAKSTEQAYLGKFKCSIQSVLEERTATERYWPIIAGIYQPDTF
eukprot:s1304_g4.t1